ISLAIATSLSVGVALYGAFLLRSTARRTRNLEIQRLQDLEVGGPGQPSRKECDEVIGLLRQYDEGVFAGPWHDPVVRTLVIPVIPLLVTLVLQLADRYMV